MKKIIVACMALVVFAAIPAMASASPGLTKSSVLLATGSAITATNSGNVTLTTSAGNIVCEKSTMTGTLVTNSGKLIEGTIESASFTSSTGGKCSSSFLGEFSVTPKNLHWCIKSIGTDEFEIRGGGCSEAARSITFILDTAFAGECKYEAATVKGTYVTNVTPVHLTATKQKFTGEAGNGGLCPATGELDATYALSSGGTGLTIS